MSCMKYFRIFILSPLVRMIRVVLFLCRVYLPRSSFTYLGFLSCCFPHLVSPVFLIESYGVNVGMYIVAASYSHIYIISIQTEYKQGGGGGGTN